MTILFVLNVLLDYLYIQYCSSVFEAGRGIGGRTSTRITRRGEPAEPSTQRYQFDHGAQYLGTPHTAAFRHTLNEWNSSGWIQAWDGAFGTAASVGDGATTVDVEIEAASNKKERWVGVPRMNSISSHLLHHHNIQVQLQTRANAAPLSSSSRGGRWHLTQAKTNDDLGTFDWLIASDRTSGARQRSDLSAATNLQEFTTELPQIQSIKSLTAMVVFETSLNLPLNGIKFTTPTTSSLGWAACDSSKPGRARNDGRECWVLQSHPDAAKTLLQGKYKLHEIRERAREVLVQDFLHCVPALRAAVAAAAAGGGEETTAIRDLPSVVTAIGHRWGAAFPLPPPHYTDRECQLVASAHFVACGDYFQFPGRIEGAYLSGKAAAEQLLRQPSLEL